MSERSPPILPTLNIDNDEKSQSSEVVMQGITIAELFEKYELTFNQLAGLIYQFIEILDVLNSEKIRHNNFQPDNIMIQDDGIIAIMDYSSITPWEDKKSSEESLIDKDAWFLGKIIQSYFVSWDDLNVDLYQDIAHDCSNRLSVEECQAISKYLELSLHNEIMLLNIEDLKQLPIYKYVSENGGVRFIMRELAASNRKRAHMSNRKRLEQQYKFVYEKPKSPQKFLQWHKGQLKKKFTRQEIRRSSRERSQKRSRPYNPNLPVISENLRPYESWSSRSPNRTV